MKKKIAVLIPCYNEEQTIAKVVKDYKKNLPGALVYVYDNNSTDKTVEVAKSAGAIVGEEYRQGKGNVIRTMFREVEADCYLMVDGDDTYPADKAREMCEMVLDAKADMVIGDRLSSNYFKENNRRFHNMGNRLVRFLINLIFNSDIKDVMSGYRALSRSFVKTCPILSRGFEVETEMIVHALDKNFLIKEVPVSYKNRKHSDSKVRTVRDGLMVLKAIVGLFEEHKPMLFFGILAMISFVSSLILGVPVVVEFFETGMVLRFPTLIVSGFLMIVAFLMLVCGILLRVISKKHRELFELVLLKTK